jgi:hypothetical protein
VKGSLKLYEIKAFESDIPLKLMHDDYNKDPAIFLGHSFMYQQCTTCTTAVGRAMHFTESI